MACAVTSKPELATYADKLSWVRHQIAHDRATSMAAAVAKNPNDMQIGNLDGGRNREHGLLDRLDGGPGGVPQPARQGQR